MTDQKTLEKEDWRMGFARNAAKAGKCSRKKVGAAIFVDDALASTGFNGAARGARHCDHTERYNGVGDDSDSLVPGDMENGHCAVAIHAEMNSIINAARKGVSILGGTMYVTVQPCFRPCAPAVVNAGIKRIVYEEAYRPDERALALYRETNVHVQRLVLDNGVPVHLEDVAGPYGIQINGITFQGGQLF